MKCKCAKLPDVFYLDDGPKEFQKSLQEIDVDTQNWVRLYECPYCNVFWVIDEWDKYLWQVVIRIRSRSDWPINISEEKRKVLLLKARGGTIEETCIHKDCLKNRVKGVVYCIDHLYETGVRK